MKIVTYPNPILENVSAKVELPLSDEDKFLISEMWKEVRDTGIGLAAPQVGVNKQICIIHLDPEIADKKDKKLDFVMINPEITFYSELEVSMVEGCLSFPDEYWEIYRPANIIVQFQTISNFENVLKNPSTKAIVKTENLKAKGWMSRVIQHEVDHLNGKVFIKLGGKKLKTEDLQGRKVID